MNPIRRLLSDLAEGARPPAARSRGLSLEALESREVPAALVAPGIEATVVGNFYTEILGREAAPGEVNPWVVKLQSGLSPDAVARGFLDSVEYRTRQVNDLYQAALGRPADSGSQGLVALLQSGGSERQALTALLGSAEFNTRHADNADFVKALYQAALGRTPGADEVAHYTGLLTAGRTRAELIGAFVNSPERSRVEVNGLFQRYLGRPADAGSLQNMANALSAGAQTLTDLAALIASSAENQFQALARAAAPVPVADPAPNPVGAGQPAPVPAVDTDADGLTDAQEQAGWAVTVTLADGTTAARRVTSDPTKKDTDGDGIEDARERLLGTDPTSTDTDGDTITDPAEAIARTITFTTANGTTATRQASSDPLKADTDGDGLDDSREKALGTDPSATDSDVDGAADARELEVGSDPLKADTDGDDLTDGEELAGWTVTVTKLNGARVSRPVTSSPLRADTDGDGLDDRREKGLGTDPRLADSDADALTDIREVTELRSNPLSQDTDGDGVGDGAEAAAGTPVNDAGPDTTPPRVVGATSLGNTKVLLSFSEAMADSALTPAFYRIAQTTIGPEAGGARVLGDRPGEAALAPRFYNGDRRVVELNTSSQNELNYTITAFGLTDLAGNPFGPPTVTSGGRVDPSQATFRGTPPGGALLVDTDGDGLTDNDELRGWQVTVTPANGVQQSRWVTSDPFLTDTDGDGFTDNVEAQLRLDPRDQDSDDDLLTDWQEYTEIFSDHLKGDSDGDGVDDGTEFLGVKSSPVFADTDGDQIPDGVEIPLGGPRNILVSDLPRPDIAIGGVNLSLDVRFTETNNRESRDLGVTTVRSSLANATSNTTTVQHTANVELFLGFKYGQEDGEFVTVGEANLTAGYTYNYTRATADETRQEYEKSLQTEREVTSGFVAERTVVGASMQAAVNLRNLSDLAFNIKNLQVTALILDPLDRTKLTPVATLVPEFEPSSGFALGPLVPDRGPIIFKSTTVIPSLVESLMANSTGLIFRLSNYDVLTEGRGGEPGRNFAFVSQDVVERTAAVLIDFGGANQLLAQVNGEASDGGRASQVESYRVATASGRATADTNGDGKVDFTPRELFDAQGHSLGVDANGDGQVTAADAAFVPDRRVTFDTRGSLVGITFHQAMSSIGLTRYDEGVTPTANLTPEQVRNSYSTRVVNGLERIVRVRGIANDDATGRYWQIVGRKGIERDADLERTVLTSRNGVSLNYVQDIDGDGLPADVEYVLRTSDRKKDTDGDGLDDRFEALIGWQVTTPQRTYQVYSSPNRADSNFDAPMPGVDSDRDGVEDRVEYSGSDADAAPGGWNDANGNGLRDEGEVFRLNAANYVLDPVLKDTDGDGIDDATEIIGFRITRLLDGTTIGPVRTDPTTPFTDADPFSDGFERRVGLDPTNSADTDNDGDGLPDPVERAGWRVTTLGVSTTPLLQGSSTTVTRASRTDAVDSDGDGLTDYEEFFLKTDPLSGDTDGDGLPDRVEYLGYTLGHDVGGRNLGVIKTNPLDADTDNDLRSDGAEAELTDVEANRWVVRPVGRTPYRVFSSPIEADADFDGLVDGQEFNFNGGAFRSDPNDGNTDDDARDDGIEFSLGSNPLVEDFLVTVVYTELTLTEDGDATGPGEVGFDLGVRRPDRLRPSGLSDNFTSAIRSGVRITAPLRSDLTTESSFTERLLPDPGPGGFFNGGAFGIGFTAGPNAFRFASFIPQALRSVTFGMTRDDIFAVEGALAESDFGENNGDQSTDIDVYLGGMDGVRATYNGAPVRPVFRGTDLLASPNLFQDLVFTFTAQDNVGPTQTGALVGNVKASFYITR